MLFIVFSRANRLLHPTQLYHGLSCIIHECLASSSTRVVQQTRVHSGQSETLPWPVPAVTFSLVAPPLWRILLRKEVITEMTKMLQHWPSHSLCTPVNWQDCGSSESELTMSLQCSVCVHVKKESMAVHNVLHEHKGRFCFA